ncbi:MAG TPA: hypothetical protein VFP93_01555 [Gammaproteobacteria bacterium]|nr:hypothetical protein [Gammaproteobacteria bacterium]
MANSVPQLNVGKSREITNSKKNQRTPSFKEQEQVREELKKRLKKYAETTPSMVASNGQSFGDSIIHMNKFNQEAIAVQMLIEDAIFIMQLLFALCGAKLVMIDAQEWNQARQKDLALRENLRAKKENVQNEIAEIEKTLAEKKLETEEKDLKLKSNQEELNNIKKQRVALRDPNNGAITDAAKEAELVQKIKDLLEVQKPYTEYFEEVKKLEDRKKSLQDELKHVNEQQETTYDKTEYPYPTGNDAESKRIRLDTERRLAERKIYPIKWMKTPTGPKYEFETENGPIVNPTAITYDIAVANGLTPNPEYGVSIRKVVIDNMVKFWGMAPDWLYYIEHQNRPELRQEKAQNDKDDPILARNNMPAPKPPGR